MITPEEKHLVQRALQHSLNAGCEACSISLSQGEENSIELRNGEIDKLTHAVERQMVIHLYTQQRYGSISTNRLEWDELKTFIDQGIAATRLLEKDADRSLPEAHLYYRGNGPDLEQEDKTIDRYSMQDKMDLARQPLKEVDHQVNNLISIESSYSDVKAYRYLIDSQGFEACVSGTLFGITCNLSLKDKDDARPEAYWYDSSIRLDQIHSDGIGTKALERALQKIGQQKIAGGTYDAVIDSEVASQLLSPMLTAIKGGSLYNKKSFLADKLGHCIASEKFSLYDMPHQIGAINAQYFDQQGIATKPRTLIGHGELNDFLLGPYYAKKLKMEPTIGDVTLLRTDESHCNCLQLCQQLEHGIYITGLNGGNCNPTTGDFSYGVEGLCIEKGVLTTPFSEMILTGNMIDLWKSLIEIGNDSRSCNAVQIPSLLFEQVILN